MPPGMQGLGGPLNMMQMSLMNSMMSGAMASGMLLTSCYADTYACWGRAGGGNTGSSGGNTSSSGAGTGSDAAGSAPGTDARPAMPMMRPPMGMWPFPPGWCVAETWAQVLTCPVAKVHFRWASVRGFLRKWPD